MSYKNDHALTIANKWGAASSSAKAELYETYDRLRDLTVSGSTATGSGFGTAGGFLWQLANLFSPSAYMPVMGGSSMMNIPGTSYWSPNYATSSYLDSGTHSFGVSGLSSYSGFPSGAAGVDLSFIGGTPTGGAAGLATGYAVSAAGIAAMNSASYAAGSTAGLGYTHELHFEFRPLMHLREWRSTPTVAGPHVQAHLLQHRPPEVRLNVHGTLSQNTMHYKSFH